MNWLKRKLNKWFFNDDIDERYEYENEEEVEIQETTYKVEEQHRPKFRFPVIADDELRDKNIEIRNEQLKTYNENLYNQSQDESTIQVYDVETSRIHELLEMRRQRKRVNKVNNDFASNRKTEVFVEREKKKEPPQKEQQVKQETINPLVNRKRFIPTDVPSPVHGFHKPKPINTIFSNKQEEHEEFDDKQVDSSLNSVNVSQEINELQEETNGIEVSHEVINDSKEQVFQNNSQELVNISQEIACTTLEEIDKKLEQVKENVEQIIHQPIEKLSIMIEKVDENQEGLDQLPELIETSSLEVINDDKQELENEVIVEEITSTVEEESDTTSINENILMEDIEPIVILEEETLIEEDLRYHEDMKEEVLHEEMESLEEVMPQNVDSQENVNSQEESETLEDVGLQEEVSPQVENELQEVDNPEREIELQEEVVSREEVVLQEVAPQVENKVNTLHVENLEEHVNELPTVENIKVDNEEENSPKEKPIPFNVIMLKSDKEKLQKKMQIQQIEKPIQTIVETKDFQNQEQVIQSNHDDSLQVLEQLTEHETEPLQEVQENKEVPEVQEVNEVQKVQEENKVQKVKENQEAKVYYKYVKPPLDCLTPPEESTEDREWMESQADVLVESLSYFQVTANVESIMQGPAVTQFEITVGHGTKVSKIRNLSDDLKLALAAKDIRIQAPIPGKNTIGIEIPNRISRAVRLSEVVNSESFLQSESPLEAALGLDLTGKPVTIDLRKMPHGLIAGATGSGKSVCINSLLVSLLLKAEPSELKLMLIDPKMVELAPFNHIPHLVSPVITDVKAANAALKWAVDEMERRYQLFAHSGVRDLPRYNKLVEKEGKYSLKLPYLLIVIDELADLMMMAPQDVEESICRIAQKARACGIHLIIATQRPSVDVITGLIKSNIPTRIAFAVSSQIDSRTILDSQGAERLLGRGDMLYLGNGMTDPIRLQGTFVTDEEIEEIIEHVREQGEPDYFFEQEELLKKAEMIEEQDELFEEVCRFVYEQGSASTSSIQRKYHIGYNRAARLIEMLESYGFISEQKGSKPRDVFITESDLAEMFDR